MLEIEVKLDKIFIVKELLIQSLNIYYLMLAPSSTRNKGEKTISSARFFKKIVQPTDENEKNGVNYLEKLNMKKANALCQLKKNN